MREQQTGFDFDLFSVSGFSRPAIDDWTSYARKAASERAEKDRLDRERKAREDAAAGERRKRAEREHQERREEHARRRRSTCAESPWDVLGVSLSASAAEIRAAWKRLCKQHHPDTGGDLKAMQRVNAAYNQLKRGKR